MMKCSKIIVGLLVLASCLSAASGQSERNSVSTRKCERIEMADETRLKYDMNPKEHVLMMWHDGAGTLMPLSGLIFPEYTRERNLRLIVQIMLVERSGVKKWRLSSGTCDSESSSSIARLEDVEEGELPLPLRSIPISFLNGDEASNVEMLMVPYRVVGERVESLVYAIASDVEILRVALQGALEENINFSWDNSFYVASTPATRLDKSKWTPVSSPVVEE